MVDWLARVENGVGVSKQLSLRTEAVSGSIDVLIDRMTALEGGGGPDGTKISVRELVGVLQEQKDCIRAGSYIAAAWCVRLERHR